MTQHSPTPTAPELAALDVRLSREAVRYMNLTTVGGAALTAALIWILSAAFIPAPWNFRVPALVTVFIVVTSAVDIVVLNPRERQFFSLRGEYDSVRIHRGRFIETDTILLRSAIVSVDIARGPLLRRYGLAKAQFNGIGRVPELPPLTIEDALMLQAVLKRPGESRGEAAGGP